MAGLTPLESAALSATLAESGSLAAGIDRLLHAEVLARENTGGGFFTTLAVSLPHRGESLHLGEQVWVAVEGLKLGLGIILHLDDERLPLLEGYAIAPEDTSQIDLELAQFAIVPEPGPWPPVGS